MKQCSRHTAVLLFLLSAACSASGDRADCEKALHLPEMPMRASYASMLASVDVTDSEELIRCLVENIVRQDPIDDPREAPPFAGYVIGDTAFFLLVSKFGWPIEEFLDASGRDAWQRSGIYAYFDYVQSPDNRRKLADRVTQRINKQAASKID